MPGAKQIDPPLSMDCDNYDVEIVGPSPSTTNISGQTALFENLLPGSYTVNVTGNNASSVAIGYGSNTVEVTVGTPAPVTVIVEEHTGVGNFHLDLSWAPSIIDVPVIVGVMTDWLSVDTPIVFTGTDPVLAFSDGDVTGLAAPGWYAAVVTITDGGVLSCGFAEIVRIAATYTTVGDIFLAATEGLGAIDLNIVLDFFDPLHFTGTPAEGAITIYNGVISFSVVEDDAIAFTGIWYLNGEPTGDTGASADIDGTPLLADEDFRLDFIGFSTDGKHAGDAHWVLTKSDSDPNDMVIRWNAQAQDDDFEITIREGATIVHQTVVIADLGANEYVWTSTPGDYTIGIKDMPLITEYWQDKPSFADADVVTYPHIGALEFGDITTH